MAHILTLLFILIVYPMACATCASAQAPISADEVLGAKPFEERLQSILNGEIVSIGLPSMESGDELDVDMALLVPAPLQPTVTKLHQLAQTSDASRILAAETIPNGASPAQVDALFGKVSFGPTEKDEVRTLMNIGPGSRYNLSSAEIGMIRRRAQAVRDSGDGAADADRAMSRAMGEVLKGRYLAYQKAGLSGVPPYQVGPSQQVSPALELTTATESMRLLKNRAHAYFQCLLFFPDQCSPEYVHQFSLTKQEDEHHRPLFVLKHWISDIHPDYALITERQYYLSHTLNSLQVTIGCLPYRGGTLVVLFNQTFTDKVDVAVGKSIVKLFGRMKVEKHIRPIFEGLQAAFER
jgi:hypothetical protein